LDGHYIVGVGDFSGESEIVVLPGALSEADEYIQTKGDKELSEQVARVGHLIDGFETPYGMELLATVHWVATQEPHAQTADEAVVAVHNWNPRKKAILREDHIRMAWRRLSEQGWFRPLHQTTRERLPFQ
jgi:hypothetical protein